MNKSLIQFGLASLILAGSARAEFVPVINTTFSGGAAAVAGEQGAALGLFDLYAVPAWKRGRFSLLPALSGSLGGQQRSIEEGTIFERSAQASFAPVFKLQQGFAQSVRLKLQALRTWNLQTANETWGKGLYDYEQFGIGAGYERPSDLLRALAELSLDFSHRSYPNFRNVPEAAALLGNKNYYYKDFYATTLGLTLTFPKAGIKLSYNPEYKAYTDSYVVQNGGATDLGKLQQDWIHPITLEGMAPFGATTGLLYSLRLVWNDSNQNYYDSLAAVPTFVPDVQDYSSQTLSLAFPWLAESLWSGLTLTPAYELTLVQSAKLVQNSDGAYTSDKGQTVDNGLRLGADKDFGGGFGWNLGGAYRFSRSNQGLQRGARNNFDYWQVTTGLKYTFKGD